MYNVMLYVPEHVNPTMLPSGKHSLLLGTLGPLY